MIIAEVPGDLFSRSAAVRVAPLNSAEPAAVKQGVNEADGSRRLVTVGPVGIARIPEGRDVSEPEGVTAVNANGESPMFRRSMVSLPPGSSPPTPVK